MGGKGGPLAFLNKKTWHPGNYRNQEEVWKREQKALAEEKKLEEFRKQIIEERKKQELLEMAEKGGHIQASDRLDWMYQGGMAAREDAAKREEAALMGKQAPAPIADNKEQSQCEKASLLPSFYADNTPASANETWQRLNSDPLFAIKRQEQESLKRIRENPVKMQEILRQVQSLTGAGGKDGKAKKKHKKEKKGKKEKKEKHEKKRRKHGDGEGVSSGSSSEEEDVGRHPAGGLSMHPHQPPSLLQHHQQNYPPQRYKQNGDFQPSLNGRDFHGKEHGSREEMARPRLDMYDRPEAMHSGRGYDDGRNGYPRDDRSVAEHRRYPDARDRHAEERGHDRAGAEHRRYPDERDRRTDDREHDRAAAEHRRHSDDRDRHPRDAGHDRADVQHRRVPDKRDDTGPSTSHQDDDDERRHQHTSNRYGLALSSVAPAGQSQHETSRRAEETRARLAEAAARAEAAAASAAARPARVEYKAGKLTDVQRAQRLAEMTSNADVHENSRIVRLTHAAERDQSKDGTMVSVATALSAGTAGREDVFMKAASRDVFASLTSGGATVEGRISSRRHFNQR